jgi:hypothetical protein
LTTLICALGATESGAVALVMERDPKAWSIGFDMRLFTAVYSVSTGKVISCFHMIVLAKYMAIYV